jgi:hypothetical protein
VLDMGKKEKKKKKANEKIGVKLVKFGNYLL